MTIQGVPLNIVPALPGSPLHFRADHRGARGWIPLHGVGRDTLVGMITLMDVNRTSPIDREAMQVRDIMTRDPITLPPAALVIDALRIMSAHDIERIPIVQDDKIVGIVTRMDILKVTELRQV